MKQLFILTTSIFSLGFYFSCKNDSEFLNENKVRIENYFSNGLISIYHPVTNELVYLNFNEFEKRSTEIGSLDLTNYPIENLNAITDYRPIGFHENNRYHTKYHYLSVNDINVGNGYIIDLKADQSVQRFFVNNFIYSQLIPCTDIYISINGLYNGQYEVIESFSYFDDHGH